MPFTLPCVPEPVVPHTEDTELRALVEQALSGGYELDREIGRGGMGIVYRARDKRLKRHVAIKLLPPELSFRREVRSRFLREAETAAQLNHPHIVPIYSVDEVGNLVFFVMACIDGDNLAHKLQKRGPLPLDDVRRWLHEVGDALAYAHARGVVHRDIKPDNILLDAIDGRALVTDFGIARAASEGGDLSRLTATGMAIGTPAYMSPEQASGDRDLDARSDLYSLGIVAYQMLCGEPPFTGTNTPALLVKHLAEVPVPIAQRRADIPADLAAIVMRCLEKNPDHRFQSATDLLQALRTGELPPLLGTTAPRAAAGGILLDGSPIGGMPLGGAQATGNGGTYQPPAYSPRTQAVSPIAGASGSPPDASPASYSLSDGLNYEATPTDVTRWEMPQVAKFRRRLAFYLIFNIPLVVLSIFRRNDLGGITTIWTLVLAWQYAKLWTEGYDWRDVLRQPRERLFGDVLSDLWESVEVTFDRKKRERLRAQGQLRTGLRGALRPAAIQPGQGSGSGGLPVRTAAASATSRPMAAPVPDHELGAYRSLVHGAREDREEIARLLATMPESERAQFPAMSATAGELVSTIEQVAKELARAEVDRGPEALARADAEIATLEAEANPLDAERSEARVRRLAILRRERRALQDAVAQATVRRGQLESCRLALENVRLDLVRLRTGGSNVAGVTEVAERALSLARDVERAVQAQAEVQALMAPRASS